MRKALGPIVLSLALLGCAARRPVRPADATTNSRQSQEMARAVDALGRPGDWLAIRGYKSVDDFVASVTDSPVSHAALLDSKSRAVIEADGSGVHVTPLADFVDKAYRLLLIRPLWSGGAAGEEAVAAAKGLVGKQYSYLGTLGLPDKDRYYCTELVIAAYKAHIPKDAGIPPVVAPGQLWFWGRVLYDSGPRPEVRDRVINGTVPRTAGEQD